MRTLHPRQLCLAVLVGSGIVGILRAGPEKDPDPERIAALVRQLGDRRFANREAAGKGLQAVGEKALPAIRQAAAGQDLEVATRARHVVLAILRGAGKSKATGLELDVVDEGRFDMGSPRNERSRRPDETPHPVRITRPFLIGKYEVTQAEFETVMKFNPSHFSRTGDGKDKVVGQDVTKFPVENVSWFDAVAFCNRLSALDGYKPYYQLAEVRKNGDHIAAADVKVLGGNGYRLPTEAEWELACRAWTTGAFHFGFENTGKDANTQPQPATGYGGGPDWRGVGRTTPVGAYPPSTRGLFDMHGNVAEWCQDWYARDYYLVSPVDDPPGPDTGTQRVLRGGSWLVAEGSCRSASRLFHAPAERTYYTGFRVARTP